MSTISIPLETEREERFAELVRELMPALRAHHPESSAEEVLESAIRVAAYRLSEEGFVWVEP